MSFPKAASAGRPATWTAHGSTPPDGNHTSNVVPSAPTAARPPRQLITMADFQSRLSIGKTTAFQWLREKRVRSVLVGRKRLVLLEDVDRLIDDGVETGSL